MRGPYDTPKRSHVIKTSLDDDEYESFMERCKVYEMTQSEMIRVSLDKLAIHPVLKFSPVNKELLSRIDELMKAGNRTGNNEEYKVMLRAWEDDEDDGAGKIPEL